MTLKISVDEIASIRVVHPQLTTRFVSKRKHMKIGHVLGKWYASGPTRTSQLLLVKPHSVSYRWVGRRS